MYTSLAKACNLRSLPNRQTYRLLLDKMADVTRSVELRNGKRMPIVGLGTWLSKGGEVEKAVEIALEAGYRHIDTAYVYQNEIEVGNALKKAFDSSKVKREDLFIVTKLPGNGHHREKVKHFLQKSLKALQLNYIDLYLVHSPVSVKGKHDDDFFPVEEGQIVVDFEADLNDTWKGMEDAVDEGLAHSIGLSNFNSVQIKQIYDNARIKPANLQVECHAYLPQVQLYNLCKSLNITLTAYAPIGSPALRDFVKKHYGTETEKPRLISDPMLIPLSQKYKKTPVQILLRFLIQQNIIVIPKSVNPQRIGENIQVFDFQLDSEDMATLKTLDKNLRYFDFDYVGLEKHPNYPFNIPF